MEPSEQGPRMTLMEKTELIGVLALFPALTIMVFLRRKLGFRLLNPLTFQVMALLLWFASGFSVFAGGLVSGVPLGLFALTMFIVAMFKRRAMWWSILYGESWHTYSRGVPWLCSVLPLDEMHIKRFVDPLAAAIIGVLFSLIFPWLGYYIVFSAVCLFIFESSDYQRVLNRQLDMYDNLVDSEAMSQVTEFFQQAGETVTRIPVEETAGIATGTDANLAAAIERRKARQQQRNSQSSASGSSPQASPDQSTVVAQNAARNAAVTAPPVGGTAGAQGGSNSDLAAAMKKRRARGQGSQSAQETPLPSDLPAVTTQVQGVPQSQGIPLIASPSDPAFAALPSGAPFMTPDGQTRWKN